MLLADQPLTLAFRSCTPMPPAGKTFGEALAALTQSETHDQVGAKLACTGPHISQLKKGKHAPTERIMANLIREYNLGSEAEEWYRLVDEWYHQRGQRLPPWRRRRVEAKEPDHPFARMAQEIADLAATRAAESAAEKVFRRLMESTPPHRFRSSADILLEGWSLLQRVFGDFGSVHYQGMGELTPEEAVSELKSLERSLRRRRNLPVIDPEEGLFGNRTAYPELARLDDSEPGVNSA